MEEDANKKLKEKSSGRSKIKLIQTHQNIIIASDGSKKIKLGGAWVITDSLGQCLTTGSNSNFGRLRLSTHIDLNFWRVICLIIY